MEARIARVALIVATCICMGANYRTPNFMVTAHSPQFAKQVGDLAERYRQDLAVEWLGQELPRWQDPCPITVEAAPQLGAGGATSFMFDRGRPFGWTMSIQGSEERILDSVLPHEVNHTIFATHFGGPLPRWADEGACTTVEHPSERAKQQRMLLEFLSTNRGIAFNRMFAMTEYPHDILPLYSQGHSLAQYLLVQGGKRKFIDFVGRGMQTGGWDEAIMEFYGYRDLSDLQLTWVDWVRAGSPNEVASRQQLADARGLQPAVNTTARNNGSNNARGGNAQQPNSLALVAVPTRPNSNGLSTGPQIASRIGDTAGSWYARQRDQATGSPTSGVTNPPQAAARPQPVQRAQEQVLQWNSRARIPVQDQGRQARVPVYYDAPPQGGVTMLR